MFRLIVANLIAGLLRPLIWAALAILAIIFVISVPGHLWVLYVDPRLSAETTSALKWMTAVVLAGAWLGIRLLRHRRYQRAPHLRRGYHGAG